MGNRSNSSDKRTCFLHSKDKIIVLQWILLIISVLSIIFLVIYRKDNSSYLIVKNTDEKIQAYQINSKDKNCDKVNLLIGEVSELYAWYAVLTDDKRYTYHVEITSDGQLEVGDKVLVFYSQISPEAIAPAQLEKQYGYIIINDISLL